MKILKLILIILLVISCSSPLKNQKITGKNFPTVSGQSLEGEAITIPSDFNNEAVVLLLGYKMESQFDIDRWLIALDETNTDIGVYEIPTISGLFPRMFKTTIDNGMRKGIPKEIWKGVITIYKDGDKVQTFTGTENPNNTRVILLDKEGVVRYFHDRGFAVSSMNELKEEIKRYK